jgi:hypothetical protein
MLIDIILTFASGGTSATLWLLVALICCQV